jgi:hypothetical protein
MRKKLNKNGRKADGKKINKLIRLNSWSSENKNNILLAFELPIEALITYYKKFPENYRTGVTKKLEKLINYDETKEENVRIGIVKLLISLIPESFLLIKKALSLKRNKDDYELHFTIFCYLDDALITNNNSMIEELTALLIDYLAKIKVRTARASWMAGHLLGDHWPAEKSLQALLKLATNAKSRISRESAIYGLRDLYQRVNRIHKSQIKSQIEKMGKNDRSKNIRSLSKVILLKMN